MNNVRIINNLLSIVKFTTESIVNLGLESPYRGIQNGETTLYIEGRESNNAFENAITDLFNSNKEIANTYSIKTFETQIIELLFNLKHEDRNANKEDLTVLFNRLLSEELEEYEVFHEISGVQLNKSRLVLGKFTIYNIDLDNSIVIKFKELGFENYNSKYFIGIKIKARDKYKAVDAANGYFMTFENAFNYIYGALPRKHQICIFGVKYSRLDTSMFSTKHSKGKTFKRFDAFSDIDLEDKLISNIESGNNKIWTLITKDNKSDIERRILNAIEWIGKATVDNDLSKSLVQYVFSIEGMLQFNEGAFITPSIVSQFSDWLAFILSNDLKSRLSISSYFKSIYGKRSAIAHGAKTAISESDIQLLNYYSKMMIITFLTKRPFNEMKSIKELNQYMNQLKFQ